MTMMNKPVGIIGTGSFLPETLILKKWLTLTTNGLENVLV